VIRELFNADWAAGPGLTGFGSLAGRAPAATPVTLPYDAVRDLERSPDSDEGPRTGNFPGGLFDYSKTFDVPEEYRDRSVTIEFEGVYRDAMVFINGEFAAQRPNGYTNFYVRADPYLRYGEANTIRVQARAQADSRWYTGAGIHRDTKLIVADLVHVALDGVRITTPDVDAERAVVAIATTVENEGRATRTVRITTEIRDAEGAAVASGSAPVTLLPGASEIARMRLSVGSPALWSVDAPNLYTAHTTVTDDDEVLDEERTGFGIRTLQLDPQHGLRINGETVDLRGACIHHDNGLLGSAAIARAEERRVELLKAAGFNAIRSAHNPISKAMLDACDRAGMLVMDETFDMWTVPKAPLDYSLAFAEWWERDVEAMVAKDFNHPSVILYSIGNEIFETGRPIGSVWGRKLAEKVRSLDDTRYVTNAINHLASVAHRMRELLGESAEQVVDINTFIASIGDAMQQISANDEVTRATEESHAVLDVSGINYGHSRYEPDREQFPNRIIVGSETFPKDIDDLWRLVQDNPHVIGDFTWTGWDYLGEAGIGRVDYPDENYVPTGISAPYPWLTGWVGDIDITGHRRPQSYYRETVFGLRHTPYIAVHRPQFHGRPTALTPWSWTDTVSSWSWDLPDGSPATVDVYTDADEVELLLNGRSIGRAAVGTEKAFLASFEVTYEPGELVAVSFTGGAEQARTALRTAADLLRLVATADRDAIRADDTDLAYITITLQDDDGNLAAHHDRLVSVSISGAGVLCGLGSANPRTEEPFSASECTTFDGRALAIVRPTGPGEIEIRVSADGCEPVTAAVTAAGLPSDATPYRRLI
jgi:beta-galactosidase